MLSTLQDNILLFKESAKASLSNKRKGDIPLTNALIRHLKLEDNIKSVIEKPGMALIITSGSIIRVPLDKILNERCRVGMTMLKTLRDTSIANVTPKFLEEGSFDGQSYYIEERLPGIGLDIPLKKMNELVEKAANFIITFHKETVKDITIDESNFKQLFAQDFDKLLPYLNEEHRKKLSQIELAIKKQLLGKSFKTVWFHGDYKIENILFDTKTWEIKGVIDWELSRREGLPLLDILYLVMYRDVIVTRKNMIEIFWNRFLNIDLVFSKELVISKYADLFNIPKEFLQILLVMFWLNHIGSRYKQQLDISSVVCDKWFINNVYDVINKLILRCKVCRI